MPSHSNALHSMCLDALNSSKDCILHIHTSTGVASHHIASHCSSLSFSLTHKCTNLKVSPLPISPSTPLSLSPSLSPWEWHRITLPSLHGHCGTINSSEDRIYTRSLGRHRVRSSSSMDTPPVAGVVRRDSFIYVRATATARLIHPCVVRDSLIFICLCNQIFKWTHTCVRICMYICT